MRAGVARARAAWLALPPWGIVLGGAVLLAALYAGTYWAYPGRPAAGQPGWWGWFDQGQTYAALRALAAGDFAAEKQWYPPGYALLGAPFARVFPVHPLLVVDLACLLAVYGGFVDFARRLGFGVRWSAPLFLLVCLADHTVFQQWVVPWNTTPVAALIWLGLALAGRHMQAGPAGRQRRIFLLGLLAGAMPLLRPTELALAAVLVAGTALADAGARRLRLADAAWLAAGAAVPLLPYAVLYLHIYGPRPSAYMVHSARIGMSFYGLGWKAFVLLIEPRGWFGEGAGLLRRDPWLVLGLAGLLPALVARGAAALLAGMLIVGGVLYLGYVDMLPTGLWRYYNVHYWSWEFPGFGLLGLWLLRELTQWRVVAIGSVVVTLLLLAVRIMPVAAAGERAKMVEWPGLRPGFAETYYGTLSVRDAQGELENIYDMRAIPAADGVRVLALRRDFRGDVGWAQGPAGAEGVQPRRWAEQVSLGWPCWLPPYACKRALGR